MPDYDLFNGDADGICALLQLRLAEPRDAELITGIKREIDLLKRVELAAPGDRVTVLDVSLAKNREPLQRLLALGASVTYIDHHAPGEIPDHPNLDALIDTRPEVCTSLLVDRRLQGVYRPWAVVAAFGDNLDGAAREAGRPLQFSEEQLLQLRELGICINYNGYGSALEELHLHPAELYRELLDYPSPFAYLADSQSSVGLLRSGYAEDMARAEALQPFHANDDIALYRLPDKPWARRVSGVFGNLLANRNPDRAHAVLTHRADGGYLVSVRAPLQRRFGADALCSSFPTGGGRKAAAGINRLPEEQLDAFIDAMQRQFGS